MAYLNPIFVLGAIAGVLGVALAVAHQFLVQYGECKISVNDDEEEFNVEGGGTLLQSLSENDIFIPAACGGKGSCGYCKLQVPEGGGPVLPTEEPMLTREELIDNYRLACQVKVRENMKVEIPEELLAVERYEAKVISTKPVTPLIKEIVFELIEPETIEFKPGQYIQVQIPTNGDFENRAYSIASEEKYNHQIMLNVQLVEGGLGSTYLHSLEEGDEVVFTGPYGDFVIQDTDKTIVCLAAGVGLAPFRSIVFSLLERGVEREIWLLFGARHKDDLYYYEDFKNLDEEHENFHYVPVRSAPDPDWDGETGHNTDIIEKYLGQEDIPMEAYLCGPPAMMQESIDILTNMGVKKEDIFYDDFYS